MMCDFMRCVVLSCCAWTSVLSCASHEKQQQDEAFTADCWSAGGRQSQEVSDYPAGQQGSSKLAGLGPLRHSSSLQTCRKQLKIRKAIHRGAQCWPALATGAADQQHQGQTTSNTNNSTISPILSLPCGPMRWPQLFGGNE